MSPRSPVLRRSLSIPAGGSSSTGGSGGSSEGSAGVTSAGGGGIPVLTSDLYFYRDPEAEENKEIADESKVAGAEEIGAGAVAETEDLTGEHPPDETDGVTTLVVGGDGNIDEVGGGVPHRCHRHCRSFHPR
jgi:hypothetical protein